MQLQPILASLAVLAPLVSGQIGAPTETLVSSSSMASMASMSPMSSMSSMAMVRWRCTLAQPVKDIYMTPTETLHANTTDANFQLNHADAVTAKSSASGSAKGTMSTTSAGTSAQNLAMDTAGSNPAKTGSTAGAPPRVTAAAWVVGGVVGMGLGALV